MTTEPTDLTGSPSPDAQEKNVTWKGLAHLMVVYVVWGSTYLGIRIAVREGAGFPPFIMGAMRTLVSGGLLLLLAVLLKRRVKLTKSEIVVLGVSGLLLWLGGHGLVVWAEQRTHSLFAALMLGAEPIFVALIEVILDRRLPSLTFILSLIIGFAGIAVLSAPVLTSGITADILSFAALLVAGISWGMGSILQQRKPVDISPTTSSGYQLLFGGVGLAVFSLLLREPMPTPTPEAWLAWLYLVIFGSFLAFTSYVKALQLLPISIVMTYPYVNPVIAIFLGWLILDEPVTIWTIAGAALVMLGVAGIFRTRQDSAQ
jgi:drug/metabolite transporter (DMT)-like permease